jgi:DNA (cytosine-5)-methyltransferase 1
MLLYRTDEFGPNASDTLSQALANQMLPTPTAADGTKMSSNPETSARRMEKGNQASLTDIVQTEMLPPGYLLPTRVAHDSTENIIGPANHRPDKEDSLARALHHLLPALPLLKTPVAADKGLVDRPERYLNRNEPGGQFDLSDQVAALLPTPTCSDANGAGPHGDGGPDLRTAVTLLPTPLTSDANTPITHTQPDWERVQLRDIGALLPTPRAQNGESRNQNIYARPLDQPQNLENALALLPTPLASDYKQAGFQPSLSAPERSESISVAIMNLLPTPTVMDMGSNYTPEEWEAWKLKQKEAHRNGNGHGASLTQEALSILPLEGFSERWDNRGDGNNASAFLGVNDERSSEGRSDQILPNMRNTVLSETIQERTVRGSKRVSETSSMQSELREQPTSSGQGRSTLASEEAPQDSMRELRSSEVVARSSHRQGHYEQLSGQSENALRILSSEFALDTGQRDKNDSSDESSINSGIDWGKYTSAIRRWEMVLDRKSPDPTIPGVNGRPRLSPYFVEFMMGLESGHVTGHGLRPAQELKALGNGVCPQQALLALHMLLD